MSSFRFPLQKALEWRQTQLELEEQKFRQQTAGLADLDRVRAEWVKSGADAERQVRLWSPIASEELTALGTYRLYARTRAEEVAIAREQARQKLEAQRGAMLEARRGLRLLERLRERRLAEWKAGQEKELQELAGDSYLARWNAGDGG
jgi:hypothetical protein